jgi:hypothetical protein
MPKIVTTITKKPTDPWILITTPEMFTTSEMDNIMWPYIYYVKDLPGFIPGLKTNNIYDNVFVNEIHFDTENNLNNAFSKLFGANLDERVVRKNALLKQKTSEAGVEYTIKNSIEL